MKRKYPDSFYNPITLAGAAIAAISFGLIIFLVVLEAFDSNPKPYMGIIAFVVLPSFLILGLILIAFGIYKERIRLASGKAARQFPIIDLNIPSHRLSTAIFSVGTILLLVFSAFGSFKAYEYTDSDEFCGTICHKVMEPEYTAYQTSPHAKVGCVKCHIGPGAGWFVRAKLSGAYQVYSVIFNKYSRPIPTPVENLRPAQGTCEQCHWPKHFYGEKKLTNYYYASNEANTPWSMTLLIKIGGGHDETGVTTGIHWHMNINNEITYTSLDKSRMVIPFVRAVSRDGKVTEYRTTDTKITDKMIADGVNRKMDCIDCHNRPSHIFHNPATSVNNFMSINEIDPQLPYIKSTAVNALEKNYTTKEIALDSINFIINNFYEAHYPEIEKTKKSSIQQAIKTVQKIYNRNYFPYMNANWRAFPNQIGHMYAPGCFRCHDGKHVSKEGKVISHDCNVCHTLIAQEFSDKSIEFSLNGIEYKHPIDIGDSWKTTACYVCHSEK